MRLYLTSFNQKFLFMNTIAIIGVGVVGLELALSLSKFYKVMAYDHNRERIRQLQHYTDKNQLVDSHTLKDSNIIFLDAHHKISAANIFIVSVPTYITPENLPDLKPLKQATKQLATVLKPKDIVIYQSSVYPKTTEDILMPILEQYSGLAFNHDFFIAYSPERFSPKDSTYELSKICKVISVSHPCILDIVNSIYQNICQSTYIASNIAVAECCKMLENIQRNINIALMNEFSKICHAINIPLEDVIKASSTKKNFVAFHPGLVGGYCIPINPIYMIYQAKNHQVDTPLMKAAQQVNESMPHFIFEHFLKIYFSQLKHQPNPKIGIFGLSFKPDYADTRHSLSLKLIELMNDYGLNVLIHDPFMQPSMDCQNLDQLKALDICILLVKHQYYLNLGLDYFIGISGHPPIIMDVGNLFSECVKPDTLIYWRL
jgi:UDP-N-acetyl-D-galactosamine dehydrogenase